MFTKASPGFLQNNVATGPPTAPPAAEDTKLAMAISASLQSAIYLKKKKKNASANNSSCMICLDASAEGACISYGHVAGCMSCLNEVKAKKWDCHVCQAKIVQVIKLYHVRDKFETVWTSKQCSFMLHT
ncbi:putative E3 ubiquitin-protein ligase XBAT35, partial [Mucuna pruriens]